MFVDRFVSMVSGEYMVTGRLVCEISSGIVASLVIS